VCVCAGVEEKNNTKKSGVVLLYHTQCYAKSGARDGLNRPAGDRLMLTSVHEKRFHWPLAFT